MSNYKYIKMVYRLSTSNATSKEVIWKASEMSDSTAVNNENRMSICSRTSSTYIRAITYNSDTSLNITNATLLGGSGNVKTLAIPTSIVGLK